MTSSYKDFIVNKLKNTASKTELQSDLDALLVVDEDNNISSGKFKDVFDSMGLIEEVPNENGKMRGKNISTSLNSIQTTLLGIQASITNLTTRVSALEPPVITLLGDASITFTIPNVSIYEDTGATATDNVDGDLTSSIVVGGLPDTNVPGEYTITYNVTDSAGNAATEVTRTVSVVFNPEGTFYLANEANKYLGAAHQLIYQGLNNRPGSLSNVAQGWQELSVVKKSDGYYTLMSYQGPESNRRYYYLRDNGQSYPNTPSTHDNLNFTTEHIEDSISLSVSLNSDGDKFMFQRTSDGKYIYSDGNTVGFESFNLPFVEWTFTTRPLIQAN